MAEEQEITTRLKARLDQWSAYNQHTQTTDEPTQQPVADLGARYNNDQELEHITSAKMLVASPPIWQHPPVTVADTVGEQRIVEKHIADLQAAVEHERERNHQLAQTVRREQALHYITLSAETPERPTPPVVQEKTAAPQFSVPAYPSELFLEDQVNRRMSVARVAPMVVAILLILGILVLFNYVI